MPKKGAVEVLGDGERGLRRWDPLELLEDVRDEMWRLWNEPLPAWPRRLRRAWRTPLPTTWLPTLDIYEKGRDLVIQDLVLHAGRLSEVTSTSM